MVMSKLQEARVEIARRMRRAHTFADIESQLIDPGEFSESEKAALWLYGWSFVPAPSQRREATAHIDRLAAGPSRDGRMNRRRPGVADVTTG
jgi:hypothetical protein